MYKMLDNRSEMYEPEGGRRPTEGSDVRPDPEVPDRPKRRRYTESYKRKVIKDVSELRKQNNGNIGIYLRGEGIYFSMVRKWEKKFAEGSGDGKKPGVKQKSREELQDEIIGLRKELKQTKKNLAKSELIIEIQKKISKIMKEDKEG